MTSQESIQRTTIALLVAPAVVCLVISLYYWGKTFAHVRPDASPLTPLLSWRRDYAAYYTEQGQRHLAQSLRWRLIAIGLMFAAFLASVVLS